MLHIWRLLRLGLSVRQVVDVFYGICFFLRYCHEASFLLSASGKFLMNKYYHGREKKSMEPGLAKQNYEKNRKRLCRESGMLYNGKKDR